MVELCVVAPEVAVTVTLKVPAGVPVTGGGGGGPPPPQETIAKATSIVPSSIRAIRKPRLLCEVPSNTIPTSPKPSTAASVTPLNGRTAADERAVVLIVRVVLAGLPFGVTVAGLNPQLEAPGNPLQAKLTVPLKPPCGVMEIV